MDDKTLTLFQGDLLQTLVADTLAADSQAAQATQAAYAQEVEGLFARCRATFQKALPAELLAALVGDSQLNVHHDRNDRAGAPYLQRAWYECNLPEWGKFELELSSEREGRVKIRWLAPVGASRTDTTEVGATLPEDPAAARITVGRVLAQIRADRLQLAENRRRDKIRNLMQIIDRRWITDKPEDIHDAAHEVSKLLDPNDPDGQNKLAAALRGWTAWRKEMDAQATAAEAAEAREAAEKEARRAAFQGYVDTYAAYLWDYHTAVSANRAICEQAEADLAQPFQAYKLEYGIVAEEEDEEGDPTGRKYVKTDVDYVLFDGPSSGMWTQLLKGGRTRQKHYYHLVSLTPVTLAKDSEYAEQRVVDEADGFAIHWSPYHLVPPEQTLDRFLAQLTPLPEPPPMPASFGRYDDNSARREAIGRCRKLHPGITLIVPPELRDYVADDVPF